jgi:hypothetical protein
MDTAKQPVSYLQKDPRWKDADYSSPAGKAAIGGAGCGPTAAAMVVATHKNKTVTPVTAAAWSKAKGYSAGPKGTYYSYFTPFGNAYGLTWQQLNGTDLRNLPTARQYHDKAMQAIRDGHMVICCMGPGNWTSGGHFILWWGLEGADVLINDPNSTAAGRVRNKITLLQAQVKYYWVCYTPKKEGPDMPEMTEERVRAIVANEMQRLKEEQAIKIDNTPDSYANVAVAKAMQKKILQGNSVGNLMLHSPVTRQDMMVILERAGVL